MQIYERVLRGLLQSGDLSATDKIIVLCGGSHDARVLEALGFSDVVITNLDERYDGYCEPFAWRRLDAEETGLEPDSFDWAFVHAGLHHCASPHRAFLEMIRIARKGALVVEARDSLLMRIAVRAGMAPEYELEAVVLEGGETGGLRNGPVPNYIYRWTEREVRKAVEAAYPGLANDVRFFYGLRLPDLRMAMAGGVKHMAYRAASLGVRLFHRLFPSQGNEFAFALVKSRAEKPWMRGGRMRPDYELGFDPAKYRGGSPAVQRLNADLSPEAP